MYWRDEYTAPMGWKNWTLWRQARYSTWIYGECNMQVTSFDFCVREGIIFG